MPRKQRIQDPNDPMAILARVALEEQAEKIQEKNRKKQSRDVALRQMRASEEDKEARDRRMQSICDHLLGNHRIGVVPERKRCALHKDYLSDKSVRIYCGKCRFEWKPGDKADEIVRTQGEGKRAVLPNQTRKSWREINQYFYSFENSADLTSRAFRIERVEPEDIDSEEARILKEQQIPVA
jgi:hypothetical protein